MGLKSFRLKRGEAKEKLFRVTQTQQSKTATELLEESKFSQSYYFRLLFSSVIVISGVLMNNLAIILAGMLVAPLLTPILTVAMGFALINPKLIIRSLIIIAASIIIIVGVSALVSLLHPANLTVELVERVQFNLLYFLISVFSGAAATLAWTKQRELAEMTSGIAIAVTILPPLALMAVGLISFDTDLVNNMGLVFGYNFISVLMGSLMVFLVSRFSFSKETKATVHKELAKEEKE